MPGNEISRNYGMLGRNMQLNRERDFQPTDKPMFVPRPAQPASPAEPSQQNVPFDLQQALRNSPGIAGMQRLLQQPVGPGQNVLNPAAMAMLHLLRGGPKSGGM